MSLLEQASLIVTPNAYKENVLYSVVPNDRSGDLDVVRATTATRVNADGLIESVGINTPRLDYSGGGCPSILVEPQRTNLVTYSEQFDNASWLKTNSTITANSAISPDGNLTADKFIATSVTNQHQLQNFTSISVTAGQTITRSVFVKYGGYPSILLSTSNYALSNSWSYASFNLLTKTFTGFSNNVTYGYEEYEDNWFRIWFTVTVLNSGNDGFTMKLSDNPNNATQGPSFLGDDASGVYIWGAQLEQGSNATSYIPTVASTVTRNADVISKTGIADLIGQTEGTIFIDADLKSSLSDGIEKLFFTISQDFLSDELFFIRRINNDILLNTRSNAITTFSGVIYNITDYNNIKIAVKYSVGSLKTFVNGVNTLNTTIPNVPICNSLSLGSNRVGTGQYEGGLNSFQLYKTALTDEQCILLTGDSYVSYAEMANALNYIIQ